MCQLGTKLSCHSSMPSSSSCVANCCCSRSSIGTFEVSAGSLSAPELRSPGAQSLSQELSSPQPSNSSQALRSPLCASSITAQDVHTCIPRGSIVKSRKDKSFKSSKGCDKLPKQDPKNGFRNGQPLTRSKSLQSFSSCDSHCSSCMNTKNCAPSNNIQLPEADLQEEEKCSRAYLLKRSQDIVCNHLPVHRYQVNGQFFKGSKAQRTVLSADSFCSPPSGSSSSSSFLDKILTPQSSVPSSNSGYSASIINQSCDISHTPSCSKLGRDEGELSQKPSHLQPSDTTVTDDNLTKHNCIMGQRVPSPVTPENSLDSFSGLTKSDNIQAMPELLASDCGINVTVSVASKKARLDFDSCAVGAIQAKELCGKKESSVRISTDSATSMLEYSCQPFNTKCAETGPVLRRKRKFSDNKSPDSSSF